MQCLSTSASKTTSSRVVRFLLSDVLEAVFSHGSLLISKPMIRSDSPCIPPEHKIKTKHVCVPLGQVPRIWLVAMDLQVGYRLSILARDVVAPETRTFLPPLAQRVELISRPEVYSENTSDLLAAFCQQYPFMSETALPIYRGFLSPAPQTLERTCLPL